MADDESTESPVQPIVPDEPPTMEMDLTTPAAPPAPELAAPGVYVCIDENVGEHPQLGVLTFGEEYDYSTVQDPVTLAAIAACVEGGYLEQVESSAGGTDAHGG